MTNWPHEDGFALPQTWLTRRIDPRLRRMETTTNGHVPRLILAGMVSGAFLVLGADLASADPEPSPVGPAPPAHEDPPPPPPYPALPPPLANPWCGPADVRPSACFPGEAFYSRLVPPGYYGPPSWYTTIGVPLWMPP